MASEIHPALQTGAAPRVGVPWSNTEREAAGHSEKMENYLRAVRDAGGEPVLLSLSMPRAELEQLARTLDALVLPGSGNDVNPARYGVKRHPKCAAPDDQREKTDYALLNHTFAARKPVLAICYGVQLLNVYLGGTLLQDIASELPTTIRHDKEGLPAGADDPVHKVRIEAGSKLAALAGQAELAAESFATSVNSAHHQSVLTPGRGLHITACAPDGVVEAVEWAGDANWIVGVQWHPERMRNDWLAEALFRKLVAAARHVMAAVR